MKGTVYIVSAGQGDPGNLTEQAMRVLRSAEVVLHDDSVAPAILQLIPASTQVRNVHKLVLQAGTLQEKVISLLISAAREGHQVVRLKANATSQSDLAGEESEALAQAGINFELIPGATSSMGAAAAA